MKKSCKQLFSMLAVLAIAFTMFTVVPIFAGAQGEASALPTATIGDGKAKADETLALDVVIAGAPELETIAISDIKYDEEALELVGVEWKVSDATLANWDEATKKGAIAYSEPTDLNGSVAAISFKVKDDADDGEYVISCTISSHECAFENISGSIEVYSIAAGDVNGNEKIDKNDAIHLLMYLFFPEEYPINQAADYNKDGKTDKNDAIYLLMYTFFPEDYPLGHVHTGGTPVEENKVGATCKKEGSYEEVIYCSECNKELSRTEKPIPKTHNIVDGACATCGELASSEGLTFELNADGKSYTVTGIGTCAEKDIVIGLYNNLPVTAIGVGAFESKVEIESVILNDSVTTIGDGAFALCTSLAYINIPDSVTYIGEGAFLVCPFTSVEIPAGVTHIGDGAFSCCLNLESFTVEEGNENYYIEGNCLIEKESGTLVTGFYDSVIPSDGSVKRIGNYAFFLCINLNSIVLPDSVTQIGDFAFSGCIGLTNIEIPKAVRSLGIGAFYDCTALESISLPFGITYIDEGVFSDCINLESIEIPFSVVSVNEYAFDGCTKLEDVYYGGTEEEWYDIIIGTNNAALFSANLHYNSAVDGTNLIKYVENVDFSLVESTVGGKTVYLPANSEYFTDPFTYVELDPSRADGTNLNRIPTAEYRNMVDTNVSYAWDGNYIYMYVAIEDPTLMTRGYNYCHGEMIPWENDSFELWYIFNDKPTRQNINYFMLDFYGYRLSSDDIGGAEGVIEMSKHFADIEYQCKVVEEDNMSYMFFKIPAIDEKDKKLIAGDVFYNAIQIDDLRSYNNGEAVLRAGTSNRYAFDSYDRYVLGKKDNNVIKYVENVDFSLVESTVGGETVYVPANSEYFTDLHSYVELDPSYADGINLNEIPAAEMRNMVDVKTAYAWDGDYIYMYVTIDDPTLMTRGRDYCFAEAVPWHNDSFEFWYTFGVTPTRQNVKLFMLDFYGYRLSSDDIGGVEGVIEMSKHFADIEYQCMVVEETNKAYMLFKIPAIDENDKKLVAGDMLYNAIQIDDLRYYEDGEAVLRAGTSNRYKFDLYETYILGENEAAIAALRAVIVNKNGGFGSYIPKYGLYYSNQVTATEEKRANYNAMIALYEEYTEKFDAATTLEEKQAIVDAFKAEVDEYFVSRGYPKANY